MAMWWWVGVAWAGLAGDVDAPPIGAASSAAAPGSSASATEAPPSTDDPPGGRSAALEVGAQFGFQVSQNPRLYDTRAGAAVGFWSAPRVTWWGRGRSGVEAALGLTVGSAPTLDAGFLAVTPTLSLAFDPWGEGRGRSVRPVFRAGVGADARRLRGVAFDDVPDPYWRAGWVGVLGASALVPVRGALRVRVDLDGRLEMVPIPSEGWKSHAGLTISVGVSTRFRIARDRDKDRVLDADDLCPDQAEDADGFRDRDGCPERDNDEDGVRDELDACDADPEDLDGDVDEDGCPE
jgi:hypothetical protein